MTFSETYGKLCALEMQKLVDREIAEPGFMAYDPAAGSIPRMKPAGVIVAEKTLPWLALIDAMHQKETTGIDNQAEINILIANIPEDHKVYIPESTLEWWNA